MENKYIAQLWNAIWRRKTNVICMLVAIVIYCLNQLVLKKLFEGGMGYFCNCYLNDLVCPLFFLSCAQIMLIWAKYEIKNYIGLLLLGMSAGCVWEYFAPVINHNAVTDVYDLVCYFGGIQIYYFVISIEKRKNKKSRIFYVNSL